MLQKQKDMCVCGASAASRIRGRGAARRNGGAKGFLACLLVLTLVWLAVPAAAEGSAGKTLDAAPETVFPITCDEDWQTLCQNASAYAGAVIDIQADFSTGGVSFPEPFTGLLRGNGHTVTGMTGTDTPMFRVFAGSARNLTFGDARLVATSGHAGGLAAAVTGTVVLENLVSRVNLVTATAGRGVGGLIGAITGENSHVTLRNCRNEYVGDDGISGICSKNKSAFAGGLIGKVSGDHTVVLLEDCVNDGPVTSWNGKQTTQGIHGGFVGVWEPANGSLTFVRCVNNGDVTSKDPVAGFLAKGPQSGENNSFELTFQKCVNNGNIEGVHVAGKESAIVPVAAGFVANAYAASVRFDACYNAGTVTGAPYAAGFAVNLESAELEMQYCSNRADIRASVTTETGWELCSAAFLLSDAALPALNVPDTGTILNSGSAEKAFYQAGSVDVAAEILNDDEVVHRLHSYEQGTLFRPDGRLFSEASSLTTLTGMSVRAGDVTGIRFCTTILRSEYEALENARISTIIAPMAYVESAGDFTKEALAALGHPVNYLEVEAVEAYSEDGERLIFAGSLVDIYENHYELEYAARGCLTYEKDGETVTVYADYSDHVFARSIYEVCVAALADPDNGLTDAGLSAVTGIVNAVEAVHGNGKEEE